MPRRRLKRLGLVVCLAALAACGTLPPADRHAYLPPQPPAALKEDVVALQRIQSRHGDRSWTALVQWEVRGDRLAMAGTTPTGQTLFTLQYVDRTLTSDTAPWVPAVFQPATVLADTQLVFWPAGVIAGALAARGLRLAEPPGRRIVYRDDGTPLITVSYSSPDPWAARITVRHHRPAYRYTLQTLNRQRP